MAGNRLPSDEPAHQSKAKPIAPDPSIHEVVGGYELLQLIGKGGAGQVFRAERQGDGMVVALKVLSAAKLSRERVVQRFFDEARTASLVKHPSLVNLIEFIEEENPRRLAYAMEYVEGESLREKLKREHALNMQEAIDIARQVCDGVAALHAAGIIHRDLKPENIMLVPPERPKGYTRAKVLDFGVAKFLSAESSSAFSAREAPGTFVGTPRYMAPEQAAGGAVDARSDLFAIGVMLFEMITGVRPHEGDSLKAVVMAKLKGAPRITMTPEREILPQELTDVVDSCLKLQPDLRPKTAADVVRALSEAYVVLSAVGPIRLVPEGGLVRESAPFENGDGEARPQTATFVIAGGVSDNLAMPAPSGTAVLCATSALNPKPRPATGDTPPVMRKKAATIAPRRHAHPLTKMMPWVLVALTLIGVGYSLYRYLHDRTKVAVAQPEPAPVVQPDDADRFFEVRIESEPSRARLLVGGEVVGDTPHRIRIPRDVDRIDVTVEMPGYRDELLSISRHSPSQITVQLTLDNTSVKKNAQPKQKRKVIKPD